MSRPGIQELDFSLLAKDGVYMSKVCATAKDFQSDKLEIRLVTPAIARSLINSSEGEVKIAGRNVRRYANEIRIGLWNKPKHTVSINGNTIESGHEYLYGILEANIPGQLFFDSSPKSGHSKPIVLQANKNIIGKPKPGGNGMGTKACANGKHSRFVSGGGNLLSFDDDEDSTMTTRIELIDPARAAEYLEKNTRNRRVRQHKVIMYAADMAAGDWKLNHQGIAFYGDGTLADGQHRLLAIIKANVAIKMTVARGLDRSSGTTLDIGGVRNDVDLASALGIGVNLNSHESAVSKAMKGAPRNGKAPRQESLRFAIRHLEAIRFAISVAKTSPANNSLVRAAIARAYYTVDHETLRRFGAVVASCFPEGPHEYAAVALSKYLSKDNTCLTSNYLRASTTLKIHAALSAFVEGRSLAKLQEVSKLVYLLPEEIA